MSFSEKLELLISADPSQGISAFKSLSSQATQSLDTVESRVSKFGANMAKIGAGGLGVGAILTELGSSEKQAEEQLSAAVSAAGQSIDDYRDRIEKALSTEEQFNHGHEDTDAALTKLTAATQDTGKALDLLGVTTQYAAFKHESLADAASTVAKILGGSTRPLKELGIVVKTNADGTKDYAGAIDEMNRRLAGQAEASVNSFTGHLRVLGTEVKDRIAEFGEQWGPAILGVSTGLTALGGVVSGTSAMIGKLTTAHAANAVAAEADAVAEGEAAVGADLVATNSAAAVEGLYAESAAADTATASLGMFALGAAGVVAGIGAAAYGLNKLADATGFAGSGFDNINTKASAAKQTLSGAFADPTKFTPQGALDGMTKLVETNRDYAKSLVDAGTNTSEFMTHLIAGGDNWKDYADKIGHAKGVTDDDRTSMQLLATTLEDQAQSALQGAIANGQLDKSVEDAAIKANTAKDGTVNWMGVLTQLAGQGAITAEQVQAVNDAANAKLDTDHLKAYQDELKNVADKAHEAEAAALELAPADIRVQRGKITIDEDKQKIADAQAKLAMEMNAPLEAGETQDQRNQKIASDMRDIASANLDLQQAVLDEAQAEAEQAKQQDLANGIHRDASYYTDLQTQKTGELAGSLKGPVHDALMQNVWDMTIAENKAKDLLLAQEGLAGVAQGALSQPYQAPERIGNGNILSNAAGGDVGMGDWSWVGERGPELVRFGASAHVYSNSQSTGMMGGQHNEITVVHPDAFAAADETVRALNRRRILAA